MPTNKDPESIAERRALVEAVQRLDAAYVKAKRMRKIGVAAQAMMVAEIDRDIQALQRVLSKHY